MASDGGNIGRRGELLTTAVGASLLRYLKGAGDFWAYVTSIFRSFQSLKFIRMRSVNAITLGQIVYTGIHALPITIVIAGLVGGVVIIQGMTNLPKFGIAGYFGNLLVIIIARELGPLVTALIVISRSGTAISTEIATQKWSREILSLEISGIDPRLFIVIPRIAASIVSIFSLIIFFDIAAFLGGYLISLTLVYIPVETFFQNLVFSFTLKDLLSTVIKSLLFGLLIPLISCYYGMMPRSKFEIPIYVSRAVSRTLFIIVVLNVVVSVLFYFTWLE
ncbi:MAG: ABC transporter permease [Spirochaetes bacterium]|nr:ABC transporter permease [Spirochaetota bacterium]